MALGVNRSDTAMLSNAGSARGAAQSCSVGSSRRNGMMGLSMRQIDVIRTGASVMLRTTTTEESYELPMSRTPISMEGAVTASDGSMPSPRRLMIAVSLPMKMRHCAVRMPRARGVNDTSPRPMLCAGTVPGTLCTTMRNSSAFGPTITRESALSAKGVALRVTSTTVESRRAPTRTRCISTSRVVSRGHTIENSVSEMSVLLVAPRDSSKRTMAKPSAADPVMCCCVV